MKGLLEVQKEYLEWLHAYIDAMAKVLDVTEDRSGNVTIKDDESSSDEQMLAKRTFYIQSAVARMSYVMDKMGITKDDISKKSANNP